MAGRFIRFDINTVKSYTGELPGGVTDRYMKDKADQVQNIAKTFVHVKSGDLQRSIKVRKMPNRKGFPAYMIGSNNKYARYHHEGSGQIRKWTYANKANNLAFFWEKAGVFFVGPKARYTYRPPNRFLTNALARVF